MKHGIESNSNNSVSADEVAGTNGNPAAPKRIKMTYDMRPLLDYVRSNANNNQTPEALEALLPVDAEDWNVSLTEGPQKGATPLYLSTAAVVTDKPGACKALNRLIGSNTSLEWNIQCEGPNKGTTPLYCLTAAVIRDTPGACETLNKLIDSKTPLHWNIQHSGVGPHKGVTPLYLLTAAVVTDKPGACETLNKLIDSKTMLDWNWQRTEGSAALLFWLTDAVSKGKPGACKALNRLIDSKTMLDWNRQRTEGTTPLYSLTAAVVTDTPGACETLNKLIDSKTPLDWNSLRTQHSAELLFWLTDAVSKGKPGACKALNRLIDSKTMLDWNRQRTEGDAKGTTPLYLLTAAVVTDTPGACETLNKLIDSKTPLDWNIQRSGEESHKGTTPLHQLLSAAISRPTDTTKTALELILNKNFSDNPSFQSECNRIVALLPENQQTAGTQLVAANRAAHAAAKAAAEPLYVLHEACKKNDLSTAKTFLSKLKKNDKNYIKAHSFFARHFLKNATPSLAYGQPNENRQAIKANNQTRRNDLFAAFEAALEVKDKEGQELRRQIGVLYVYGKKANIADADLAQNKVIGSFKGDTPEDTRAILDEFRKNRKLNKRYQTLQSLKVSELI